MKKIYFLFAAIFLLTSCAKKNSTNNIEEIKEIKKNHQWFAFTQNEIISIDSPQAAPDFQDVPWTEAVRISSAGTSNNKGYAILNRLGLIEFNGENFSLTKDIKLFQNKTADALVFSDSKPVFYLYENSFFNNSKNIISNQNEYRPFLVQFNSAGKIFIDLVSYENLNLDEASQITEYLWDGKTWACSAKKADGSAVAFSYFKWIPQISLTDLSPALGNNFFECEKISESEFRKISSPKLYDDAPKDLKKLLSKVPLSLSFYASCRTEDGFSPVSFYNSGKNDRPLNVHCQISKDFSAAVFQEGTTYIIKNEKPLAFKLPKLPHNFFYGEFCSSGNFLYVSWEEKEFYKTKKSGFIKVDVSGILNL